MSCVWYLLTIAELDRNGNQDSLRFPMFHEELLHQAHWDAGDMYGRIRVVISEGFTRPLRNPPFERVRDLIAFSYQHAPLGKLRNKKVESGREKRARCLT